VVSDGDADHVVQDPNVVESYLGTNPPLPQRTGVSWPCYSTVKW